VTNQRDKNTREIPLSWFGKTLWLATPLSIGQCFYVFGFNEMADLSAL
jgi:hypothetical protein